MSKPSDPYNVFDRTAEETQRAYDLFCLGTSDGAVELAVCAVCGQWARWDSELTCPAIGCYEGKRHVIARVLVRAEGPFIAERGSDV